MALKVDTDLGNELVTNGTAIDDTKALTKTGIYDAIIDEMCIRDRVDGVIEDIEPTIKLKPKPILQIEKKPNKLKCNFIEVFRVFKEPRTDPSGTPAMAFVADSPITASLTILATLLSEGELIRVLNDEGVHVRNIDTGLNDRRAD